LIALKDCKRVVELRYKTILVEQTNLNQVNESLLQQNLLLETQNTNQEDKIDQLEIEKREQTEILAEVQQSLVVKTSEYEAAVRGMQVELDTTLDQLDSTRREDADKVKGHYSQLFHEKAAEVMSLREDLDKETVNNFAAPTKTRIVFLINSGEMVYYDDFLPIVPWYIM